MVGRVVPSLETMEAVSESRARLRSEGDTVRLFRLEDGVATEDRAAERFETLWERLL